MNFDLRQMLPLKQFVFLYHWSYEKQASLILKFDICTSRSSDISLPESVMMTSSNENIFRVTGHSGGEFTVTG